MTTPRRGQWNWEADNPFGAQKRKLTPMSSDAIKYSISGMTLRISIAYRAFSQKVLARHDTTSNTVRTISYVCTYDIVRDVRYRMWQESRCGASNSRIMTHVASHIVPDVVSDIVPDIVLRYS